MARAEENEGNVWQLLGKGLRLGARCGRRLGRALHCKALLLLWLETVKEFAREPVSVDG